MMISIELGEEKQPQRCECCGGEIFIVYGFIYRDEDAYAIYHASWSKSHLEAGVDMALEFDDWGNPGNPEKKYSVCLVIRPTRTEYHFQFIDPEQSAWGSGADRGRILSRTEALTHPEKNSFLHVAEHIVLDDPRLNNALNQLSI